MIYWIMIGSCGFCFGKLLQYGIVNMLGDKFIILKLDLVTQAMDFFWIGVMMVACRPRKQWPSYFTLSINDLRQVHGPRGGEGGSAAPPPFLVGAVTCELLAHKYD
jgi:hypothetical protein